MLTRLLAFASLLLLLLCSACAPPITSSTGLNPSTLPATPPQAATLATGDFQEYPLPQTHSGLMRPALDHQGRLWFGEMGQNYLAVFDTQSHTFEQMVPPHGAYGIMGIAVAEDNTIWFAEQYANYIGHYFPTTHHYQVYTLPTLKAPATNNQDNTPLPSAPNEIAIDQHGNIWFTELNSDAIGKLDSQTGTITQYSVSPSQTIQTFNPYGITIDPQGSIWFTEASKSQLGRLDPSTGSIRLYPLHDAATTLMEVTSDTHGIIWATTFNTGQLLRFDPATQHFSYYHAPSTSTSTGGMYGLLAANVATLWMTVPAENALGRFDTTTLQFTYYHIPSDDSSPLGITMDAKNSLWFTEAGSNKIGQLQP